MERKVEIISQSVKDAVNAQNGGAKRTELVCALSEGGLTPSYGMVEAVLKNTDIEVAVMIRPTHRTFYYDRHYLEVMKKDAEKFQEMGVERLVIGILDKEGNVDIAALDYVLENIDKAKITFHRAIDESKDILESVRILNSYEKVTHILTSGGPGKAVDNLDVIEKMIEIGRPRIMLGSGLSLESVSVIKNRLKDIEKPYDIHFGTYVQDSNGEVQSEKVKPITEIF